MRFALDAMRKTKFRKVFPGVITAVGLVLALSSNAQDLRFPETISCTPSTSIAASVQTGVLVYPDESEAIVWNYIENEQYAFINEGEKVVFSTRHLNSGTILEMMRRHTTYSIDLVNKRFVMVQAMAGDPTIPNPAIGALVSGQCSIMPRTSESDRQP